MRNDEEGELGRTGESFRHDKRGIENEDRCT